MEKGYTKIRAAMLIVSIALFVLLLARSRWSAPHQEGGLPRAVMVEVKGDISKPGIYILNETAASVAEAAAMSGCAWKVPSAIAPRKLISGQSLEILRKGTEITIRFGRMPGAALLACGLKLDLNSASLDEFLLIPHMRADIADSIVKRRRLKPWEGVDDLTEIHGVGPKTAQKLNDYLEVSADITR